jgi:4-aminobutyrate aminotransferase-like enzyme
MAKHEVIGDVRGVGLATGVELVLDRKSKTPAGELVPQLLNRLRDQSVLMGGEGKFGNVLKIRPPIVFTKENAQLAVSALDRALEGIRHGVAG